MRTHVKQYARERILKPQLEWIECPRLSVKHCHSLSMTHCDSLGLTVIHWDSLWLIMTHCDSLGLTGTHYDTCQAGVAETNNTASGRYSVMSRDTMPRLWRCSVNWPKTRSMSPGRLLDWLYFCTDWLRVFFSGAKPDLLDIRSLT